VYHPPKMFNLSRKDDADADILTRHYLRPNHVYCPVGTRLGKRQHMREDVLVGALTGPQSRKRFVRTRSSTDTVGCPRSGANGTGVRPRNTGRRWFGSVRETIQKMPANRNFVIHHDQPVDLIQINIPQCQICVFKLAAMAERCKENCDCISRIPRRWHQSLKSIGARMNTDPGYMDTSHRHLSDLADRGAVYSIKSKAKVEQGFITRARR
jgi:hypothetical protein